MNKDVGATPEERERWLKGWSEKMEEIFKEKINLLGAVRKGSANLLHSVSELNFFSKDPVYDISHDFAYYGIYVDRGTGREFKKGNPGDLGFTPVRQPKPWLSKKFYSSYMRLMEYSADSMGAEFAASMVNILEGKK